METTSRPAKQCSESKQKFLTLCQHKSISMSKQKQNPWILSFEKICKWKLKCPTGHAVRDYTNWGTVEKKIQSEFINHLQTKYIKWWIFMGTCTFGKPLLNIYTLIALIPSMKPWPRANFYLHTVQSPRGLFKNPVRFYGTFSGSWMHNNVLGTEHRLRMRGMIGFSGVYSHGILPSRDASSVWRSHYDKTLLPPLLTIYLYTLNDYFHCLWTSRFL